MKQVFFSVFFLIFAMTFACINAAELPPEAKQQKLRLQKAAAAAKAFPSRFGNNVNTGEPLLFHIDIYRNIKVNGKKTLNLSKDLVPALALFKGFIFETDGGKLQLNWSNGQVVKKLHYWWGKNPGKFAYFLPISKDRLKQMSLIFKGNATIKLIRLYSPKGISLKFDSMPWGVPGSDKPTKKVKITIDATSLRAINGICGFDRKRYMRVYNKIDSPDDFMKAAKYFTSKGFFPSRDAGYNLTAWSKYTTPDPKMQKQIEQLYPKQIDEVVCFSRWPKSMKPNIKGLPDGCGTPAINKFNAAAKLAAKVIKNRKTVLGNYAGPYCEVKNESDISVNWSYFAAPQKYDAWKLLAEFHNLVADAIKKENPGWLVGGPSSCMPAVDYNNFRHGRSMLRFLELTRNHLDFYSLHFYEPNNFQLNSPDSQTQSYLFGRLEGILDLLQNKMLLDGRIKPILITEFGNTRGPANDIGYWKFIRSTNGLLLRFMQRPDSIKMTVPFIIPISFWCKDPNNQPRDNFRLFVYDKNHKLKITPLRYYLELWSDYKGRRIAAHTNAQGVTTHALINDQTIYLAVNNLAQRRLSVNISGVFGHAKPTAIEQTRLYLENGRLHFKREKLKDLSAIPLAFDETSIIKIKLDKAPTARRTLNEKYYYGDKIMRPTGQPVKFKISCAVKNLQSSILRVALGRENGFQVPATVKVNGTAVQKVSLKASNKKGRFYGCFEIPLKPSLLKNTNTITINIPQQGGLLTSAVLKNTYTQQARN